MRCFEIEDARVTKGIPIIALPYPHIGVGVGSPGQYTKIGISTRLANSLQTAVRKDRWQCRYNQLDHGCPRKKFSASCDKNCASRQMIRTTHAAEYSSLSECCVTMTPGGNFLIVSPRGGDSRGLLHVKLGHVKKWQLSFFRIDDKQSFSPGDNEGKADIHCRGFSCFSVVSGSSSRDYSPVPLGESVKLLAAELRGSESTSQQAGGCEYLIVMDPGTAFDAVEDDAMASARMSAYYDGQNVHTFFVDHGTGAIGV